MQNLIIREYSGNTIQFKMSNWNVYANATSMCKTFDKKVNDWLRIKATEDMINEISSETGIPASQLILVNKGNSQKFEQGTWIHEELILELASWLNVKFRRWCQKQIATLLRDGEVKINKPITDVQKKNIEIRERYSKIKLSQQFTKLAEMTKSETYKKIMIVYGTNVLTGQETIPLPIMQEKTYTAKEIGSMLNISPNMVGRLTNEHGLKTEKYGIWVQDKKSNCNGEITTFRYYKDIIEELKKVI